MSKIVDTTTATNKKLRELITGIKNQTLIPNPEFQRRLVWTNKDKVKFLKTVLEGYPFPEIYVAAGEVNSETAEGTEMLVDGQQRITTLYQYFIGSPEIRLPKGIVSYENLTPEEKRDFLEYSVVVRDLGRLSIDEIKNVFTRINSTKYSLNAMEINNARYDGEFKKFAEEISQNQIFEDHNVFSATKIRRMEDIRYALTIIATVMSSYFARDKELETFLERYNDDFPEQAKISAGLNKVFMFIAQCNFDEKSRVWKEVDLFTLIIELYKKLSDEKMSLDSDKVSNKLKIFYSEVDGYTNRHSTGNVAFRKEVDAYYFAVVQGTNDRSGRATRGAIIASIVENA